MKNTLTDLNNYLCYQGREQCAEQEGLEIARSADHRNGAADD